MFARFVQEIEFNKIEVLVEHLDGQISVGELATGPFCVECHATIEECLPWLSVDEAGTEKIIDQSEGLQEKLASACDVKYGRKEAPGQDQVTQEKHRTSDFSLILRGHDKAAFTLKHNGVPPEDLGVPPKTESCPLMGEVELYYTIKAYERRVSMATVQRQIQDCLPRQLFDTQSAVTLDALKNTLELDWLSSLKLASDALRESEEIAKTRSTAAPEPTVAATSVVPGPVSAAGFAAGQTANGAGFAKRPVVFANRLKSGSAVAPVSKPLVPLFNPVKALHGGSVWRSAATPDGKTPSAPQTPAKRHSSTLSPSPSLRVLSTPGTSSPAELASKRRRTSETLRDAVLGTSGAPPGSVVNLRDLATMPGAGAVPSLLSGTRGIIADDDAMSTSANSNMTLAKEFPTAHKFERPLLKWTVEWALAASDPTNALRETKKMETEAAKVSEDASKRLKERHSALTSASQLVLMHMRNNEMKTIHVHLDRIVPKYVQVLPGYNYAHLTARAALEDLPPRCRDIGENAFLRLTVCAEGTKRDQDCKNPFLWCNVFSDEDLQETVVPAALKEAFSRSLFPSLIKDGMKRKGQILKIAKRLITMYGKLPAAYTGYESLVGDCKGLVLLYGTTPFEDKSSPSDVDRMVKEQGPLLEAIEASPAYNAVLSTFNHTLAAEEHAWPEVQEATSNLEKFAPASAADFFSQIDHGLSKMSTWKAQCREGSLGLTVQAALSKVFNLWFQHLQQQSGAGADVDGDAVLLLDKVKRANIGWVEPNFGPLIEKLSVYAKRHHAVQSVLLLVAKCEIIINAEPSALHDLALSLADILPEKGANTFINLETQPHKTTGWEAVDKVARLTGHATHLSQMTDLAAVADRFIAVVDIKPAPTDTGFKEQLKLTAGRIQAFNNYGKLHMYLKNFDALATTDDGRHKAQGSMVLIKKVMQSLETCEGQRDVISGIACEQLQLAIENLLNEASAHKNAYADLHCQQSWPTLLHEHENLKPMAAASASLEDNIPSTASIVDFLQQAEGILGKLDTGKLIAQTKACHMVTL